MSASDTRSYDHVCKYCKGFFSSSSLSRMYCSMACSNRARTKQKPIVTCESCGSDFALQYPSVPRKYCSLDCSKFAKIKHHEQVWFARGSTSPMTPAERRSMKAKLIEEQGNTCAICSRPVTMTSAFDHCHVGQYPRGVLCIKCNSGLGMFDDNIEWLRRAAAYLEGHK